MMSEISRRTFLSAITVGALWQRPSASRSQTASPAAAKLRYGVCTNDVAGAVKYGFDYIEPSAADIAGMSEDKFREYADQVLSSPIRCEAFNSFIRRPELVVLGNDVPVAALNDYMEACLARCRKLGASIVVWGSAGSRKVPDGFSRERARQQIAEFLRTAGDIARRYEIVIAIEPLRRQESNILNSGAESLEMVQMVQHPNVRMIIDYYHMREENEDPRIVETAKDEIVHLHFANPQGRVWPHNLSEDAPYRSFFRYIKNVDYAKRISIEGRGSFDVDAIRSLTFFHEALSD
jgi:D-psicose/D-tagatose/L-ribulose 3-epimerase